MTISDTPACQCGCGEPVALTRSGHPNCYVHGHARRGQQLSVAHKQKLSVAMTGQPGPWLGKRIPIEARQRMSIAKAGRTLTADHRAKIAAALTGRPHPSIHHKQSEATKTKKSLAQRGPLGPNWKGGLSTINERARASAQYREWRLAVFRRDLWTCQRKRCQARRSLQAHHIKPFAGHPELRFQVDNGLTLCIDCHRALHGLTPQRALNSITEREGKSCWNP